VEVSSKRIGAGGFGKQHFNNTTRGAGAGVAQQLTSPLNDPRMQLMLQSRLSFKRLLQEGAVFTKFGSHGWPHKRFVWLTAEVDAVRWSSGVGPSAVSLKQSQLLAGDHCLRTQQLLEVYSEPSTVVMQKNKGYIRDRAKCFSIVTEKRTLDLEADSEERKNQWVLAIQALIKYRGGL